jgi:formylglycine-generating enzyme
VARNKNRKFNLSFFFIGLFVGVLLIVGIEIGAQKSSTDAFCESCHVHPHSTQTWKTSPHYDNAFGVYVHCVDCHLPPKTSFSYYSQKAVTGTRDIYGKLFKDTDKINWDEKSKLEKAVHHTYQTSCVKCHQNLFPIGLSQKGQDAHLYYTQKEDEVNCLNCHLRVGHFSHEDQKAETYKVEQKVTSAIYKAPAKVSSFENFTEFIPGSSVSFDMVAVPGGTFMMGSPASESYRIKDESPQIKVKLSPFWMGKTEVTWDEYEAFYAATASEGRTDTQAMRKEGDIDGITGPTPPYEPPDQNWGRGSRPAITMTYHTAAVYCEWLSKITGKKYRLPTEAEWEYAARGGTNTAYFFPGDPKSFSAQGFLKKFFPPDTTGISAFVVYALNSNDKTQEPSFVQPNPYGLLNMLGNVREFCSDWYTADAYSAYGNQPVMDPTGPPSGDEHVVRGGSYQSDAADVRCAKRDKTDSVKWLVTDPQMPKSVWWYSDVKDVGFRVVCEYNP